jgi:hypothetical protein
MDALVTPLLKFIKSPPRVVGALQVQKDTSNGVPSLRILTANREYVKLKIGEQESKIKEDKLRMMQLPSVIP